MPNIDLSILNQRQTPAFFADTLANRPAPSFVGRIFISTDTLDLYRDTGTAWLLLSPSSTGTITGSGAAGQVTYFSGTSSITGSNDLFWDSVNGHLGIGTNVPTTALTIFHDQNQIIQLNQTTGTNDTKIAFQNSGTPLWRIGNSYNAGANDYVIFDVVGAIQPLTIKKTTGQTFIGAQTTTSGQLVVNNATGDNHIVVIGATAPSLRINNSGSGATKQIGIGLATTTNNFIQGAADRDMAIFNSSTTASPILFGIYNGTNTQEAARISSSRNFLIGTSVDGGQLLQVNGGARASGYYLDGMTAGSGALYFSSSVNRVTLANYNANGILNFEVNGGASAMTIDANGQLGLGVTPSAWGNQGKALQLNAQTLIAGMTFSSSNNQTLIGNNVYVGADTNFKYIANNPAGLYRISNSGSMQWFNAISGTAGNDISFTQSMTLDESGVLSINTTGRPAGVGGGNNGLLWVKQATSGTYGISSIANTTDSFTYISHNGTDAFIGTSYGTTGAYTNLNIQTSDNTRATIFSNGNFRVGTGSDNGAKFQVNGDANINGLITQGGGIYAVTGQHTQGGGATQTFYTFSNVSSNRVFLITLRQSGSAGNSVVAMAFTFGGILAAYNVIQDNTNPVLLLTITSTGGLGLQLTTGSGFGVTTWDYTITQIK
jgi:phage gpG-like protein